MPEEMLSCIRQKFKQLIERRLHNNPMYARSQACMVLSHGRSTISMPKS